MQKIILDLMYKGEVEMSNENKTVESGMNRAKLYQLALFPMNNGATNVYYILILSYIATFGNTVLAIATLFATSMITVMRVFDAVTDPIIGAMMDRTNGKFGKFRPYMVIGNIIMALSAIALYVFTPQIPEGKQWLRYVLFVVLYAVWVIGYTFQTSVTRSAQSVLTNDPKQRPLFTIFNTIGSMAGMGLMQVLAPLIRANVGDYNTPDFYRFFAPLGIGISILLTILAMIGIWKKDNAKYFGIGGENQENTKISEYIQIIKANKPMQRLMIAGGSCKLALSVATNMTVLCMLYGCMMGNYDGLYLPMMIIGYVFSVPFFILSVNTSQKKGQKASLQRYVGVALVCYVVVLALLFLWQPGNEVFNLSIMGEKGLALNIYTIAFILFFGIGYGAYYATADMPIPMVADCADYETYRSGKYVPGIMGTLFSLVDKLVSSLAATIVGIGVTLIGLENLPVAETPYEPGMNVVVIVMFCLIPMIAWILTLWAMKGYELSGQRMEEIQKVNARRKEAVAKGMSLEEAMEKYK